MILAIEASTVRGSLCVRDPDAGRVLARVEWEAARGSGKLAEALAAHRDLWQGVAAVAVGLGPGSFSGVRAAIAAALGIRAVTGCRLAGICSADAVGHERRAEARLGVFADARRGEAYLAVFEFGRRVRGPETLPMERVAAEAAGLTLAVSAEAMDGVPARAWPGAAALAELAEARLRARPEGDADLEPIYLRGVVPEAPSRPRW